MKVVHILIFLIVIHVPRLVLGIQPTNQVVGWGVNVSGEATGTPTPKSVRSAGVVTAAGQILSNITAISAGSFHGLALCSDATVVGWGENFLGQAKGITNEYTYKATGRVRIGGEILSNVVAIAAGREFSVAIKEDGTLVTWGENYIPAGLSNIVAVSAQHGFTWALKRDGTVVNWSSQPSSHDYGQLHTFDGISNAVAIAIDPNGNYTRGYALRKDGTVATWGSKSDYDLEIPPAGLSNVTAIAAGPAYALALKKDGTVTGWGFNRQGQVTGIPTPEKPYITNGLVKINGEILSNVVAIAANWGEQMQCYSIALKKDGTVVGWGPACPKIPEGLNGVVAISAGIGYCLAITTNSAVADRFTHP